MRIAALDLGSNSFHLLVAEVRLDGSFSVLASDKEMLRLGDVVARTGYIDGEAAERAIATVARFKAIAESQRCDEIVALGTAALREALNGAAFAKRVRARTGVEVDVVDGLREAQLIFSAVRSSVLIDRPPALCADLGGGSLELMVGDGASLSFATSLRLGVGRLTAEVVRSDPPGAKDRARLERRVADELAPVLEHIAGFGPKMLIGSSGTYATIARMATALRDGAVPASVNQLRVDRALIGELAERIFALDTESRQRLDGCDTRRSELLPAGVTVLTELMDRSGLDELTMSEWALREGIVIAAIGRRDPAELADDPRALRRASVLALCRRSSWRQRHARQVASIATALFDASAELHGLSETDRELVELGSLLHDIGEHISRSDHDRHSAYLVENGGLRGFDPDEIRILATLGRYHIKGTPRAGFAPFGALGSSERRRAVALVAILRIADALDATHTSVVDSIEVGLRQGEMTLVVHARGEAELEAWMVRRKQELFEKTFAVSLELGVLSSARREWDGQYAEGSGLG